MWNAFQNFGKVTKILIPKKKEKRGERFEFAIFSKVSNARCLALDKIFNLDRKIKVNTSNFTRGVWKLTTENSRLIMGRESKCVRKKEED